MTLDLLTFSRRRWSYARPTFYAKSYSLLWLYVTHWQTRTEKMDREDRWTARVQCEWYNTVNCAIINAFRSTTIERRKWSVAPHGPLTTRRSSNRYWPVQPIVVKSLCILRRRTSRRSTLSSLPKPCVNYNFIAVRPASTAVIFHRLQYRYVTMSNDRRVMIVGCRQTWN